MEFMKIYKYISIFAAVVSMVSCQHDALQTESSASDRHIFETIPTEAEIAEARELSYVPGVSVIKFDEETAAALEEQGSELLGKYGITSAERVFEYAGEYEERTRREGLHRYYRVTFDAERPVTKASADMGDIPGAESVEPVRKIRRRAIFNDPYLSNQWHYINSKYDNADINVEPVWKKYTTGSSDVIVAVVDGGVQVDHPDLDVIPAGSDGSRNFVSKNYTITSDDHGTHVAGTIGAINNNGKGVCGIAGGDYASGVAGVRILSCQIFSGNKSASDTQILNAIKWGADHGALISQNSWGYYADSNEDGYVSSAELVAYKSESISSSDQAAIDYFIKYAGCDANGNQKSGSKMKGGVVFFAAGNENIDYDIYGAYEPIVSVGAFGSSGKKASYSNYGSWVDLGAPGGDSDGVWSTLPNGKYGNTISEDGYYYYMEGTSMACPHASGVAALIVSYFGGDGFTCDDLKDRLIGMAPSFTTDQKIGRKLDALYSFSPLSFSVDQITLKAHVTEEVNICIGAQDKLENLEFDGGSSAATLQKDDAGRYYVKIVGVDAPAGTYTATVTASFTNGESAESSLEYTILENHAPKLSVAPGDKFYQLPKIENKFSVSTTSMFEDEDGETLTIKATSSDESVATVSVGSNRVYVQPVSYGACTISVVAVDCLGLTAETSFELVLWNPNEEFQATTVVTDNMQIRIGEQSAQDVKVVIINATGSVLYMDWVVSSAFDPIDLDLSALKLPPGIYTLQLSYGGQTYNKVFVKK